MKINSIIGFGTQNIQDRRNKTYKNINFMEAHTALEKFGTHYRDILPITFRNYFDGLRDKTKYTTVQALSSAFIGLFFANNIEDVKALFPKECEKDGLFTNLKDYRKTKAVEGLLSIYRKDKELYPNGILKNGEDITVYLLKKIYLDGKSRKQINEDLENDLDEYIKSEFKRTFPERKGEYIGKGTFIKAFGIKRLDPRCQATLRYTDEEFCAMIAESQSEAQKEVWRNRTPEQKKARTEHLREAYKNKLAGLTDVQKDAKLRKCVNAWEKKSPEERTEIIERLRTAGERSRYAMYDAWNHSEELLMELSKFLKDRQIYKPLDLLYSDEEFKDYQSVAMTDFWDTHRDLADEFGKTIKRSMAMVKEAMESGRFEELKQEILIQRDERKERFAQEKLIEKQEKLIEEQKVKETEFSKGELNNIYSKYKNNFRKAYHNYINKDSLLPKSFVDDMADIIFENASFKTVERMIKINEANSEFPEDLADALKIQPNGKNYEKAFRLQRALEVSIARELAPKAGRTYNVFEMELDSIVKNYRQIMHSQMPKFLYPDKSRIEEKYKQYQEDLSANDIKKITERYFLYETEEGKNLIIDYLKLYGRSLKILFSDNSFFSNEAKAKFNEKFLRLMPDNVRNAIQPVFLSIDDINAEESIQQIAESVKEKYGFMPDDFLRAYTNEVINTIHLFRRYPVEKVSDIYSIKSFKEKVYKAKTIFDDDDGSYKHNSYIIIPKTNMSKNSKIKVLAAEQAFAEELYDKTGNEIVFELDIEELLSLFEFLSSNSYDGSVFTGSGLQFKVEEKPKMYDVYPRYIDYKKSLEENSNSIFEEDDIKDSEKLFHILNPEDDDEIINEKIRERIKHYIEESDSEPTEVISEQSKDSKKEIAVEKDVKQPNNANFYDRSPAYGITYRDDYNSFVKNVKNRLVMYQGIIPQSLYDDINKIYGTEEQSIRKILQKQGVVPETISDKTFKAFIEKIEKVENEYTKIHSDTKTKLRHVYIYTFSKSGLLRELSSESSKKSGNKWCWIKEIWQKTVNPNQTQYSTENLIDSFLVQRFIEGHRDYRGGNPLKSTEKESEWTKTKVNTLQSIYKGIKLVEQQKAVLQKPAYIKFKQTVNIEAMTKSLENIEEQYKNSFFEYFWTKERKQRFINALIKHCTKYDKKMEFSDDMYKAVLDEAFSN